MAGIIGICLVCLLILSFVVQLELPRPTGDYPVGRTIWQWIDRSRPEILTETLDDYREVPVVIWYPAEVGTGSPTSYIPNWTQVAASLSASGEITPLEVLGLCFVRSRERLEASFAGQARAFLVILLSPGNGTNSASELGAGAYRSQK